MPARAAYLGWRHLRSEYSQDIDTVLATLETNGPWTWTLPVGAMAASETDDSEHPAPESPAEVLQYVSASDMAEIREQYENMRTAVELWDWISMTDLRSSWYMLTHGVGSLTEKPLGNVFQIESVTLFPIGTDGILGEVQIGALANERLNRWPEVPTEASKVPLPLKRLQATILHNEFMEAIRAQDVERIIATMRPNVATAIRSYLTDAYEVVNAEGAGELATYYRELFERFDLKELRLVNRVVESWFVFAELHWIVGAPVRSECGRGLRVLHRGHRARSIRKAGSGCAPAPGPILCRRWRTSWTGTRRTWTSAGRRTGRVGSSNSSTACRTDRRTVGTRHIDDVPRPRRAPMRSRSATRRRRGTERRG